MSSDQHAERRAATAKGGPRVLTFNPTSFPKTLTNCIKCFPPEFPTEVLGEDGTPESTSLLVHGWYQLETDVDLFWQQVNPEVACGPMQNFGAKLAAGACVSFFVDDSLIDGVIYLAFCALAPNTSLPDPCLGAGSPRPEGLARVIRKDTISKMSVTGDTAAMGVPQPSQAAGPKPFED